MQTVVKIGGSLADDPTNLKRLCLELSLLAKTHRIIAVPGGGEFADITRKFDKTFSLSSTVAHKMAILAMDQYGLLLSDIIPDSYVSHSLKEINNSAEGTLPIFLASTFIFREDPLEHSWDVTSDSIAAYIAGLLQAKKLILVTDVDGIFSEDPKKNLNATFIKELSAKKLLGWNKRTSVDKTLPKILQRKKVNCYVVNGRYPKRVRLILENVKTICTHLIV
jgi:aspartokinase-like uncharacterized kinase